MILFQSPARPIWRRTWLRLLLASSATAGLAWLIIPRLPAAWVEKVQDWQVAEWVTPSTMAGEAQSSPQTESSAGNLRQIETDGMVRSYMALSQLSHGMTERFLQKQQAPASYGNAIAVAQQAMELRKQENTLELRQQEKALWQEALRSLEAIGSDAAEYPQAQEKLQEYKAIATVVDHRIQEHQSKFLADIAAAQGNPNTVRISLCQLGTDQCRSYKGNVPPASLASLVKLPIAVALMHQVTSGQADLDKDIYIDPGNFTENAQGAKFLSIRPTPCAR